MLKNLKLWIMSKIIEVVLSNGEKRSLRRERDWDRLPGHYCYVPLSIDNKSMGVSCDTKDGAIRHLEENK